MKNTPVSINFVKLHKIWNNKEAILFIELPLSMGEARVVQGVLEGCLVALAETQRADGLWELTQSEGKCSLFLCLNCDSQGK